MVSAREHGLGALLGTITALSTAGYLLAFRQATHFADRSVVLFAMLLGSALLNTLVIAVRLPRPAMPSRRWTISALILGGLTIAGNGALVIALPRLGPGITSTMLQTQIFFVAFMARVFLGERIGWALLLGAIAAVAGISLFTMPGLDAHSLNPGGLVAAVLTSLCFSAMLVWTRAVIQTLDPVSLNTGRLWLAVAAMAVFPGIVAGAWAMPVRGWWYAVLAAAGGPVAGRLCLMYALRFIAAAEAKLWTMLSPVFAFGLVFAIFGTVPSTRELVGAALVLTGVLLPSFLIARRAWTGAS